MFVPLKASFAIMPRLLTHRRKLVRKSVLVPVESGPIPHFVDVHHHSPPALPIWSRPLASLATVISANHAENRMLILRKAHTFRA